MARKKLKAKPRKRLKSLADVRRYLAALINDTRNKEIEASLSGRLGFLLNILRSVISDSDLEQRISALEQKEVAKNELGK